MGTTNTLDKEQLQKLVSSLSVVMAVSNEQSKYLSDYLPGLAEQIYKDNLGTTHGAKKSLLADILTSVDCFGNISEYSRSILQCIFAAFKQKYIPGKSEQLSSKNEIQSYMKGMTLVINNTDFLLQSVQNALVLLQLVITKDAIEFGKQSVAIVACKTEFAKEVVNIVRFKELFEELLRATDPANSMLNSE